MFFTYPKLLKLWDSSEKSLSELFKAEFTLELQVQNRICVSVPADKQTERTHEPKGNIYTPYKI